MLALTVRSRSRNAHPGTACAGPTQTSLACQSLPCFAGASRSVTRPASPLLTRSCQTAPALTRRSIPSPCWRHLDMPKAATPALTRLIATHHSMIRLDWTRYARTRHAHVPPHPACLDLSLRDITFLSRSDRAGPRLSLPCSAMPAGPCPALPCTNKPGLACLAIAGPCQYRPRRAAASLTSMQHRNTSPA